MNKINLQNPIHMSSYQCPYTNYRSCYIAFFDILGFKDLVQYNSHEELSKIFFGAFDFSILASINDAKVSIKNPIETVLNSITISDSIIYWTNGSSLEDFFLIFQTSATLMITALSLGLPLRGAISVGPLSRSQGSYDFNKASTRSAVIGKPIVDAFLLEKEQNWSGCIVDEKCINLYLREIEKRNLVEEDPWGISKMLESKRIIQYPVPMRNGKRQNHHVINWTLGGLFENYSIDQLKRSFSSHNKSVSIKNVKQKIDNTVEFYRIQKEV